MKTASKVVIVLLAGTVGLVASQEAPRAYVADCVCCLLSCIFGQ